MELAMAYRSDLRVIYWMTISEENVGGQTIE
jgi:hypothetical protein